MDTSIYYIIFGAVLLTVLIGGLILRSKTSKNSIKNAKAKLVRTELTKQTVIDENGAERSGVTGMTLVFELENGQEIRFPVQASMRGRVQEQDIGKIMYCGTKLLYFECKSGKVGNKKYVRDSKKAGSKYFK